MMMMHVCDDDDDVCDDDDDVCDDGCMMEGL